MNIRGAIIAACLFTYAQAGSTQPASGTLTGTVFHWDGSTTVADAPVRARNEATGTDIRTRSSATGQYEFAGLPAGTYRVTVHMPCCEFFFPFDETITVAEGRANELDIRMPEGNISVEGDDPATVQADLLSRQVVPDLPVPRMPDGRPDFSGVWLKGDDPYPQDPKLLDWVGPIVEERAENFLVDLPSAHCLPGAPPIGSGASFTARFVQTDDILVMLLEDVPGYRQVFLDGRDHPERPNPTWMGHSIGRWEGDTLVIDTIGFNDRGWTEIFPRTQMLRTEERITRSEYGHLEMTITFDDPGVFAEPLTRQIPFDLAPQLDVMEYVCENNQWMDAGR